MSSVITLLFITALKTHIFIININTILKVKNVVENTTKANKKKT